MIIMVIIIIKMMIINTYENNIKISMTLMIIMVVNIPTKNPVHSEGFVCDRLSLQILPLEISIKIH